jgi:hypothetical protein
VAPNKSEYVPAGQFQQAEAPKPVYSIYVPAGHNEQVAADADVAPVCPYFPEEQGVPEQVVEELAPTISEYVPAGHFQQAKSPARFPVYSIYVPAGHNEQVAADADVAPVCPYFPEEQGVPEQVVKEVAPTISEYVPAGQIQQAEASVDLIYVPAGHNEQVAADADVAPVCPYFPEEQGISEQVVEEVAPTISEYVPAGQFQQAEVPVYSIYVPAGHNEQVAADADVAPVCPYFPEEQGVPEQVDKEVAPTISEYVPAGQGSHHEVEISTIRKRTLLDLWSAKYVPAKHNEQVAADADVAPVCPYFPAEQGVPEQVDKEVAPTISEYVPAGHIEQGHITHTRRYFPAGHNEQVAADADVAPVCPYFPEEQGVPEQFDEEVAPTISEYVPAGQRLQM